MVLNGMGDVSYDWVQLGDFWIARGDGFCGVRAGSTKNVRI